MWVWMTHFGFSKPWIFHQQDGNKTHLAVRIKLDNLGQSLVQYIIQKPSINFIFCLAACSLYFFMSSQPHFYCEVWSFSVVTLKDFRVEQEKKTWPWGGRNTKKRVLYGWSFDRFSWLPKSHCMRPPRDNNRRPLPGRVGRPGNSWGRRGGYVFRWCHLAIVWPGDLQRASVA